MFGKKKLKDAPASMPASPPSHVAIVMDGNGRWAMQKHLPRVAGHAKGVDAVRNAVLACLARDIKYLTVFAFSSENWRRPADEVSFLMRLFMKALEREVAAMNEKGVRIRFIGDIDAFHPELRDLMRRSEALTAQNTAVNFTVAANYGGRWDILQASQQWARVAHAAGQTGKDLADVEASSFASHLALAFAPEPDLFIRTGGEKRISNFMLWDLAYTELYFTDVYWPDFDASELDKAIHAYHERERRFGKTSAQVSAEPPVA